MIIKHREDFADVRKWPPMGNKSLSGYQKKKLFRNNGNGSFEDVAAMHGVDLKLDGRGVAVADFDSDGRLDMVLANAAAPAILFRNTAPEENNWIQIRLEGQAANQAAVGAQVRVRAGDRTLLQFVSGGNSFAAQSSNVVHFGLGSADAIDWAEVRWPDGSVERFESLQTRSRHVLAQGRNRGEQSEK
jgi:hypothetical protein